ncbi:expressed unknown protein [Seminavis robusta]|uniref:Uncharacterized protein n=1 Tax=Seminavis robusta TaxID=568900 RepID=A0A9N8HF03_9STRA|nr:expressed unknown protein [Seminavis robusta]|eukprot:Sro409_g137180.1 n/a (522) ;mRNA; f:28492-30057
MSISTARKGSSLNGATDYSPLGQGEKQNDPLSRITALDTVVNDNTDGGVWILGGSISLAYCCTYFWRYPIFMLPPSYLHNTTTSSNSNNNESLDLQAWFSLAFIGGFGSSKLLGMQLLSSRFFFRHRLVLILAMIWVSMLVECLGVAVAPPHSSHMIPVISVYISSFVQSWIYGALITYLEGRQQTETLLAAIIAATIAAGGMSRGTATLVLQTCPNLPPTQMPLAIGLVMATVASLAVVLASRQPPPTALDQQTKCPRQPMTWNQQMDFFQLYGWGVLGLYLAYALLVGVRSFRDFYSKQIFATSYDNGDDGQEVPSWMFFVADLPGALLSAIVITTFQGGGNHHATIFSNMVSTSMAFGVLVLVSTVAFLGNLLNGVWWQISLGIGIYGSFGILTTAIHERLIAATRTPGTCTFLVLLGDAGAYVVTLTILLLRDFASSSSSSDSDNDDKAQDVLQQFLPMIFLAIGTGLGTLWMARHYFQRKLQSMEEEPHLDHLEANGFHKEMDGDGSLELTKQSTS